MSVPKDLKYTRSHEWVEELDNGCVRVGITDFAQSELNDLVYLELPEVGDDVTAGEAFADVESVKAASEVFSPVSGVVSAVNDELQEEPGRINEDPYGSWFIEVEDVTLPDDLLSAEEYEDLVG